ncbi:hypothetical protein Agub_g2814, partial [Astrephomene gubernaculifera]
MAGLGLQRFAALGTTVASRTHPLFSTTPFPKLLRCSARASRRFVVAACTPPVKRKRGRPRLNPEPSPADPPTTIAADYDTASCGEPADNGTGLEPALGNDPIEQSVSTASTAEPSPAPPARQRRRSSASTSKQGAAPRPRRRAASTRAQAEKEEEGGVVAGNKEE